MVRGECEGKLKVDTTSSDFVKFLTCLVGSCWRVMPVVDKVGSGQGLALAWPNV
jgi:hypothetical protein